MTTISGTLDLISGPMFSSKTTTLLGRLFSEAIIGLKVLYVNHASDTRSKNKFSTHNLLYKGKPKHKNVFFVSISNILDIIQPEQYDVIGIDECQFFKDLFEGVLFLVEKLNKHVIVSGLNSSYKREKFGQLLDLIPLSDTYTSLTAWCLRCSENKVRTHALFTYKITESEELEDAGGIEKYIPVCRKCYIELSKK